ncbi:MAG: transposase, partial [Segatella sp.]
MFLEFGHYKQRYIIPALLIYIQQPIYSFNGRTIKTVSDILLKIPRNLRDNVLEVTMDFSDSMRGIVKTCFSQARITLDCFHVMTMICDAV